MLVISFVSQVQKRENPGTPVGAWMSVEWRFHPDLTGRGQPPG
jgi:hypothetical protein